MVVTNKSQALYWFNLYKGRLEFIPLLNPEYTGFAEDEFIFSHAIAKFQHLVIFEDV